MSRHGHDGLGPSNVVLAPQCPLHSRRPHWGWVRDGRGGCPSRKEGPEVSPGKFFFENLLSKFCFAGAVSAKKLAAVQSVGVQNGTVKLKKLVLHNEMTTACLPGHIIQAGNIGPIWHPLAPPLAITRSLVRISPAAAVYQRQLSMPSSRAGNEY